MAELGPRSRLEAAAGHPMASAAAADAGGRPRVFGVEARAIPLSVGGGSLLEHGIDVALLMTPPPGEAFAMRTPRGAIGSGRHFVLRCAGLQRERGALARATSVSEMGIHFDLVTAELVQSNDAGTQSATGDSLRGHGAHAHVTEPALRREQQNLLEHDARRTRLHRQASASAIQLDGVTTIACDVSATLLTTVRMGEVVTIAGPRGEIARGAYFSLRYFDEDGAKRAIVRAESVREKAGMLDEVDVQLIRLPTAADERQSYRASYECYFTAEIHGHNGARTMRGRITDVSAGGIGFRVTTDLAPGEKVRIVDRSLPDLDGAELLVVRRDQRDTQRYGARFVEPNRGTATLSTILGLELAEREHRRAVQIEEIRRTRGATAAPLTAADIQTLRNRRMGTRDHEA